MRMGRGFEGLWDGTDAGVDGFEGLIYVCGFEGGCFSMMN